MLCRNAWAPVLTEATARASRPSQARYLFRPASHARGTNTVTNFLARTKRTPGTPPLVMGRARATWLVDAVEARMYLPTLMAAAGLTTLRSVDRILPNPTPRLTCREKRNGRHRDDDADRFVGVTKTPSSVSMRARGGS
ncbi:hypothetical protein KBZ10_01500 [Streptomyces sp. F63]|uniref:hypothetical protein n=1 Tax=Streptomyces sp. F63 TaxID=2824887 RepID=UPI001B3917EE|nr:hypothetical protein [Streptomyces sp. F63]MBQ0983236.1 hypothetical protein [Streptomyces sp. F63]